MKTIVSQEWLLSQLDNPEVVVVDCRFQLSDPDWGYQQYQLSHIKGAYYLDLNRDLSAPVSKHGGRHPLPDPEVLAAKLASIGINFGTTQVIVYDDSRFGFAARLWWLLRYFGHQKVALLDGGWKNWQALSYPVSSEIPAPKTGKFVPQLETDSIVDINAVKVRQNLPEVVLVDSRDGERYRGETEPIDPIAGHIPGAVNSPWQQVTNDRGYLRSLSEQKQLWSDYQQAEEIVVYCGSGVTACVNLLSLDLVGIKKVKLYPGGWSDWCSYL